MSGRHAANKSHAPLIIVIIVLAVIAVAAVAAVFIFSDGSNPFEKNTDQTTAPVYNSVVTIAPQSDAVQAQTDGEITTEAEAGTNGAEESEEGTEAETETVEIVVPVSEGADVGGYFNATYAASYAVDSETGERCSLRDVFGSSFADGVLTFKDDGTVTDTLLSTSSSSGAYVVEDDSITITYTNDKNMYITVTEWSDGAPSVFFMSNYGGYDVYFGQ